jgi:hypothetical protein
MRCLSSEHTEGWYEASAVGLLVVFAGELLAEGESRSLENFRVQAPSFTNHVMDWPPDHTAAQYYVDMRYKTRYFTHHMSMASLSTAPISQLPTCRQSIACPLGASAFRAIPTKSSVTCKRHSSINDIPPQHPFSGCNNFCTYLPARGQA